MWYHLTKVTAGEKVQALPDHSEQLPDSISTCDTYVVTFCYVFVFLLIFYFLFLRDSNMISISSVEFKYFVVIIVLVNKGNTGNKDFACNRSHSVELGISGLVIQHLNH